MAWYDWTVVGRFRHPVPGDPELVAMTANHFRSTADDIRAANTAISQIESGSNEALFLDQVVSDARDIASVLWQALDRYDTAGEALSAYAAVQARTKHQAEAALQAALQARADHQRAASQANRIAQFHNQSADPGQREQLLVDYRTARNAATNAETEFMRARKIIDDAAAEHEAAGARAEARIRGAIEHKELNDSLADKLAEVARVVIAIQSAITGAILGALKAIAKFVWDHLDQIALALSILSLVLLFVPGPGWLVAAVIFAARAATVLARVKLAVQVVEGVSEGVRTGNWTKLGAAAAAFALSAGFKLATSQVVKGVVGQVASKAGRSFPQPTPIPTKVMPWAKWATGFGKMPGTAAYETDQMISGLKASAAQAVYRDARIAENIGAVAEDVVENLTSVLADQAVSLRSNPTPGCQVMLQQPALVTAGGVR